MYVDETNDSTTTFLENERSVFVNKSLCNEVNKQILGGKEE